MRRIHTRIIIAADGSILEDEHYEHAGPVAEAKGGGGGGTTTTTQTSSSAPWAGQQPFLTRGFKEAERQFDSGKPEFFPDSTVVPYSGETEEALDIRLRQARDPNSLLGQAAAQTGSTLRGDYLSADNPVYRSVFDSTMGNVRQGVDSAFAGSGRFGSPGHAEALGRGISAGMLPFIGQERNRQFGATQTAAQVAGYAPGALAEVGAAREGFSREELQEDINRFDFDQNVPALRLQQFMGNVRGGFGSSGISQTTQPDFRSGSSSLLTGLGAAATGASIGKDVGLFSK